MKAILLTENHISNYFFSKEKIYSYYRASLCKIKEWLENGIIENVPIEIIGGLAASTAEKAHTILKNNKTKGQRLIMIH